MELIYSSRNPRVLAWRSLSTGKGRDEQNAFLVEGARIVQEAVNSEFEIQAVLIREGYTPAYTIPRNIQAYALAENAFAAITDTKTPQGIAAVITKQIRPLTGSRLLALDGVQDPGNVGTIIRTADAAGFDGVILSKECADLFSPKVLRSTMGSIFRMSFGFPEDLPEALRALKEKGFSILSSQLDGDPFFERTNVSGQFVLIIGNEGNGVSAPVKAEATHRLRLPMHGGAESLNAAVAAGIMMYDLTR